MNWAKEFWEFFRDVSSPLALILNADGCREGWVQGELYRRFQPRFDSFCVNRPCANKRERNDLYCARPTEMVAELKVYGFSSQHGPTSAVLKRISALFPEVARGEVPISSSQIKELRPKSGSFFNDVLRLHRQTDTNLRFMILVLQKQLGHMNEFGKAILDVHLSYSEHHFGECDEFCVRISEI